MPNSKPPANAGADMPSILKARAHWVSARMATTVSATGEALPISEPEEPHAIAPRQDDTAAPDDPNAAAPSADAVEPTEIVEQPTVAEAPLARDEAPPADVDIVREIEALRRELAEAEAFDHITSGAAMPRFLYEMPATSTAVEIASISTQAQQHSANLPATLIDNPAPARHRRRHGAPLMWAVGGATAMLLAVAGVRHLAQPGERTSEHASETEHCLIAPCPPLSTAMYASIAGNVATQAQPAGAGILVVADRAPDEGITAPAFDPLETVTVRGVPPAIQLSAGRKISDTDWTIEPSDLDDVTLVLPSEQSEPINTEIELKSRNGVVTRLALNILHEPPLPPPPVPVQTCNGVRCEMFSDDAYAQTTALATDTAASASAGILLAQGLSNADDIPIPAVEPVESVIVRGLPADVRLTAGTQVSDTEWKIASGNLDAVDVVLPAGTNDPVRAEIEFKSRESIVMGALRLGIVAEKAPPPPPPLVGSCLGQPCGVLDATMFTALDNGAGLVAASAADGILVAAGTPLIEDVPEAAIEPVESVTVRGLPPDVRLTAGEKVSDTDWILASDELDDVGLVVPAEQNEPIRAEIEFKSYEGVVMSRLGLAISQEPSADGTSDNDEGAQTVQAPGPRSRRATREPPQKVKVTRRAVGENKTKAQRVPEIQPRGLFTAESTKAFQAAAKSEPKPLPKPEPSVPPSPALAEPAKRPEQPPGFQVLDALGGGFAVQAP